jgi:hypothetical protein
VAAHREKDRESGQSLSIQVLIRRKRKHPMTKNKLFIRDSSDLRIKHVNSKTVVFRRDLRIRGL